MDLQFQLQCHFFTSPLLQLATQDSGHFLSTLHSLIPYLSPKRPTLQAQPKRSANWPPFSLPKAFQRCTRAASASGHASFHYPKHAPLLPLLPLLTRRLRGPVGSRLDFGARLRGRRGSLARKISIIWSCDLGPTLLIKRASRTRERQRERQRDTQTVRECLWQSRDTRAALPFGLIARTRDCLQSAPEGLLHLMCARMLAPSPFNWPPVEPAKWSPFSSRAQNWLHSLSLYSKQQLNFFLNSPTAATGKQQWAAFQPPNIVSNSHSLIPTCNLQLSPPPNFSAPSSQTSSHRPQLVLIFWPLFSVSKAAQSAPRTARRQTLQGQ